MAKRGMKPRIKDFPDWLGERAQRDPALRAVEALAARMNTRSPALLMYSSSVRSIAIRR